MRIGLIAPPWLPVPPPGYGGTEVVIDNLARGLQSLGHDVRLFTVGDSTCPVPREFLYPMEVTPMDADIPEAAHVLAAYDALADVDIIHDHTILGALVAGRRGIRQPPVVTTNRVDDGVPLENRVRHGDLQVFHASGGVGVFVDQACRVQELVRSI